jgi:hypothetical protein
VIWRLRVGLICGSGSGIDATIIISTRDTDGSLPGIETLPSDGKLMNNSRSRRRARARRASLEKTSQKTTGIGIATQLVKKRTVGNQVINGITDKASTGGTGSASVESGNQKVIVTKGGGRSRKVDKIYTKVDTL